MGFSDLGCYGGDIDTPNLDRLAANGLRFTEAYSTARCVPSRSCLMTGRYPQQIGRDQTGRDPLPSWTRFLPEHLKPLGYRCYHSGKWHVNETLPVKHGKFDHSYLLDDQDRYFSPRSSRLDDQPLPPVTRDEGYYATRSIADHAVRWLDDHAKDHAGDPFFLYLAFTSPHFPLHALQDDIARYRDRFAEGWDVARERRWKKLRERGIIHCALSPLEGEQVPPWNFSPDRLTAQFGAGEVARATPWNSLTREQRDFQATKMAIHAAMVTRMDIEVGRVLDTLRRQGTLDDTAIVFLSDNGASAEMIVRADGHDRSAAPGSASSYLSLGPGWSSAANAPFRLHKHWIHEGGISSPMIVHWPAGGLDRGKLRHNPVHFVDMLPTLVDLAGGSPLSVAGASPFEGRSIRPAFHKDRAVKHDYFFFHHMYNRGLRSGDWKIVSAGEGGRWELYDIARDRAETRNQASRQPQRLRDMAALWEKCEQRFLADQRG